MKPTSLYDVVFLTLLGLIIYANCLTGSFLFDDRYYVVKNPYIKDWRHLPSFFTMDYTLLSPIPYKSGYYRPLVAASYFINYRLFGLRPWAFHLTNLSFHLFAAVAFYFLLKSLCSERPMAFLASLLFISSPILTGSVSFICGRHDLIVAFFSLSTFCLFMKISTLHGREKLFSFGALIACFFLALLSKETALFLPPLLLFLPWEKRQMKVTLLLFLLCGLYLLGRRMVFEHQALGLGLRNPVEALSIGGYYLKQSVLPLGFDVEVTLGNLSGFLKVGSLLFLLFLGALLIICKGIHLPAFGLIWFLLALLPPLINKTASQPEYLASRYLYVPTLGLCLFLAFPLKRAVLSSGRRRVAISLLSVFLGLYGFSVIYRNTAWQSEASLWKRVIKHEPESVKAHFNLACIRLEEGKLDEAIEGFEDTLTIEPAHTRARSNLAFVYMRKGDIEKAKEEYTKIVTSDPHAVFELENLANIYYLQGEYDKAKELLLEALKRVPSLASARLLLSDIYEKQSQYQWALREFTLVKAMLMLNTLPLCLIEENGRGQEHQSQKVTF